MAREIKATQLVQDVDKLANQLVELNAQLKTTVDLTIKGQQAFQKTAKSQSDLSKQSQTVQSNTKKLSDIEKQRIKLTNDLNKANSDSIQKNEQLKVQLQQQRKTNRDLAKEKLGLISAHDKERKKLNDLRRQYKDAIILYGENSKQAKNLGDKLKILDTNMNRVNKSANKNKTSYSQLPGVFGRAGSSVQMLNMQFKALLANPIVATIAAIVGAFIGLTKALKRSEEGQNALNKISAVLKGTLNVFLDIVTKLAENLIKAFENPQQAVKDLWAIIKENLVNRVKGVADYIVSFKDLTINTFKLIGSGIKNIFTDNQKAVDDAKEGVKNAATEMGKSLLQFATGIESEKLLNGFKAITKEISSEADIIAKLADRQAALDKLIRESSVVEAKNRREIAQLREVAAQKETISAEERLSALDRAIALENENLALNQKIAQEKLYLKETQNALGASTKEDLNEEYKLRTDLINLETSAAQARKRLESERVTALREVQAEEFAIMDEMMEENDNFLTLELEMYFKAQAEKFKRMADDLEKEKELKIKTAEEIEAKKKELREQAESAALQIATEQYASFIDNNLAKYIDSQKAEEEILKNKLDKGVISEADYENKIKAIRLKTRQEEARAEKKKALFDIAINTAVGVVKALGSAAPPANFILAAIVGALGAIQAAAVAARPLPKYKEGTKGKVKKDHFGIVGDGGQSEIIKMPSGESYLSPPFDTPVFLPRLSEVFSGDDTKEMIQGNESNIISLSPVVGELRSLKKAVLSKNNAPVWTEKGLSVRDSLKNTNRTFINKRIKGI